MTFSFHVKWLAISYRELNIYLTTAIIWKMEEMKTTKPCISRERMISRWNQRKSFPYILQRNDWQPNEMY